MRAGARILVVGPRALSEAAVRALPHSRIVHCDNALAGLWQLGREGFDGVLLSLAMGRSILRTVQAMRQVDPRARIVVSAAAADEPLARRAMAGGADDYVLEPLSVNELEQSFTAVGSPETPAPADETPTFADLVRLGDVLKDLPAGPQVALERLARLVRDALGAVGVVIELDAHQATAGDASDPPSLAQEIRRADRRVGRIAVVRPACETAASTQRLGEYARLIDAVVAQATERAHWQELAWTDDLSGLRNRRYFDHALDDLTRRAGEQRLRLTVLFFDIDDFKTYNDRFGHETGDSLIREVATLLNRCSRESDVVARYGGDEFAVILWDAERPRIPGSKHPTKPIALAERFRRAIGGHAFRCLGPEAPGPVTISGGLASFPWDGATREALIAAADEALLHAKRTGKNHIALSGGAAPAAEST